MRAWLGEHVVLVVAVATLILALVVGIIVLVTWLRSRGTFMYVDNVAKGTTDVARPWREHREIASSYFVWQLGITVGTVIAVLILLVPFTLSLLYLIKTRDLLGLPGVIVPLLLLLLLALAAALVGFVSRDFVAPLQYEAARPFGAGLGLFWGLLRRHPLAFVVYVLLKIVYASIATLAMILACCFTCCCALLPVVNQTLLQPIYYFERAWSLFFLRRLGHDLFAAGSRS